MVASKAKSNNRATYPTVILSSYSHVDSRDLYFSIDIWNNRLNFTFGDNSNKESPIIIRLSSSFDKAEYLNHLIRNIYSKRIEAYLKNEPYQNIPEDQAYTIECYAVFGNTKEKFEQPDVNNYKLKIFTTAIDGIPRLTFKAENNTGNSITVVLGTRLVETACQDPNNIVRFLDKMDTSVARLSKDLNDITSNLTLYKMFSGFFEHFIGPKYRDKNMNNNQYDDSYIKTGNYKSNATPDDITM